MNIVTIVTVVLALIGSALIDGVFFAFSSFIMKALARLPSSQGMLVMQSINVMVLNPLFLTSLPCSRVVMHIARSIRFCIQLRESCTPGTCLN